MLELRVIPLIEVLAVKVGDPKGQNSDDDYHDEKCDVVNGLECCVPLDAGTILVRIYLIQTTTDGDVETAFKEEADVYVALHRLIAAVVLFLEAWAAIFTRHRHNEENWNQENDNKGKEHGPQVYYHEITLETDFSKFFALLFITILAGVVWNQIHEPIARHDIKSCNRDESLDHDVRQGWELNVKER